MRDKVDDLCGNSIHLTGQVEGFENSLQRCQSYPSKAEKLCFVFLRRNMRFFTASNLQSE
jgi:hypothetical protein